MPNAKTQTSSTTDKKVEMPAAQRKAYTRTVELKPDSYICRHCGRQVLIQRYPGSAMPKVCDDEICQAKEHERLAEATRRRVQEHRARKAGKAVKKKRPGNPNL